MSETNHVDRESAQERRAVPDIGQLGPGSDPVGPVTDRVTGEVADPVTDRTDPVADPVASLVDPVGRVLAALRGGALAPSELQVALGLKHRPTFRADYLRPALEAGFIEATLPDKPNGRLQKYRLTPAGVAHVAARSKDTDP